MAQVISNLSTRGGTRANGLREGRTSFIAEALIAFFNRIQDWSERHRTRKRLYQMPDYILHDIGISRAEAETEWEKPFWQA